MTVLPRSATSPELALIRRDNQSSRLYLTAHQPATVYTARLAAVPSSTDQVVSITYNTGSGTHTNILADQTLLIGTTAGGFDLGKCRIRNTSGIGATTGTFNLAETSEINWSANAYLTVLDEFVPWARHLRTVGTTVYMDYDVAYSDQNSKCDSVPVLGPPRVAWLRDATVSVAFDASQSWALNNTITGYAWTFPGADSYSGETTATPNAVYDALGTYRVACAVTNSDGKTFTGYRYVFVVDETTVIDQFSLGGVRGDYSSGGWSFDVTMYDQADRVTIRDRALVLLHALDYYGDTQASVGYVAGSENVIAVGWIAGDTITWETQDNSGAVSFTVEGPQYWLDQISAFPVGLKDTTSAPSKWTRFQGLTAKVVSWHMLHWRTTLTRFTDVFYCADTHRAARIEASGAQSLWSQLGTMLEQSVLAVPCCDRYGRLFNQIEQQVLNSTEKSSIATVMTLTGADWSEQIDIERHATPSCSLADFSGVAWDGTNATPYFSLSPGKVFKQFGKPEIRDRLVLDTQTIANQRCGAFVGWKNNPYPRIGVTLAANNRLLDITPYQWCVINVASTDTVREITASSLKTIPRSIEYTYTDGYLTSRVQFEAESTAEIAVTNYRPPVVITPIETPPIITPPPSPIPSPDADGSEVWLWHYDSGATPSNAIIYSTDYFSSPSAPTWQTVAALPADLSYIRYGSITADGAVCYVVGNDTGSKTGIWKCLNPKDVSPTWSKIVEDGDSTGLPGDTGTITGVRFYSEAANGFSAICEHSDTINGVVCNHNEAYGVKYARGVSHAGTTPTGLWNSYTGCASQNIVLRDSRSDPGAFGFVNLAGGHGFGGLPDGYSTLLIEPGLLYPFCNLQAPFTYGQANNRLVRLIGTQWQTVYTFPVLLEPIQSISASFFGRSLYVLAAYTGGTRDSYLYYSLNGADFNLSYPQSWKYGKVLPANLNGGTQALWFICSPWYGSVFTETVNNSNEFLRYCADISNVAANPWTSSTGNMWTTIISAGNLTLRGACVVYA